MADYEKKLETINSFYMDYMQQLSRQILGHTKLLDRLFIAFLCKGNILLEGAPGLGKTSLAKAWAGYFGLDFRRIQFTPDLMPLDIIGSNILEDAKDGRHFRFYKGPLFTNVLLGDEINRATPKTQSAFMEAMEEKRVSFLGEVHELPDPFYVIATQNPIELEGTYPLPEAQVDRFFMKLNFRMPDFSSLLGIMELSGQSKEGLPVEGEHFLARQQKAKELLESWKELAEHIIVPERAKSYIARLVLETHPEHSSITEIKRFLSYGASPRAAIALYSAIKAKAVMDGRVNASMDDVDELAPDICAHRIIASFEAEAEGLDSRELLKRAMAAARREYDIS